MRFAVFTHVEHYQNQNQLTAYAPYVREMNIWFRQVENVEVVAPLNQGRAKYTVLPYKAKGIRLVQIRAINFLSLKNSLYSLAVTPLILLRIFSAMRRADHLHIRCPGNIGMLASIVQILFPSKPKTVKYAGNWVESKGQPLSYRFQKWLLKNAFLSKNIRVLVYAGPQEKSKNILPFFTASFSESDKEAFKKEFSFPIKFIFVGSLVKGKQPLFAIDFVEKLFRRGMPCSLEVYGTGDQFEYLNSYIGERHLHQYIKLKGSREFNELKQAYKKAHFVILPSKSEGWPKAIAEGMFYGCIPICTMVSCVPWMLGEGKRGVLIKDIAGKNDYAINEVQELVNNKGLLIEKSFLAQNWARKYTLERFESAIKKLI